MIITKWQETLFQRFDVSQRWYWKWLAYPERFQWNLFHFTILDEESITIKIRSFGNLWQDQSECSCSLWHLSLWIRYKYPVLPDLDILLPDLGILQSWQHWFQTESKSCFFCRSRTISWNFCYWSFLCSKCCLHISRKESHCSSNWWQNWTVWQCSIVLLPKSQTCHWSSTPKFTI